VRPLNTVIGTTELSAWQPVPGITWVQCRMAEHANRLAKRSDSRLVVCGMAGGYLKTYEFRHSLAWAERLIRRYTRQNHAANERLRPPQRPGTRFVLPGVARQGGSHDPRASKNFQPPGVCRCGMGKQQKQNSKISYEV
jgi:hypothetical protein